MSRLWVPEEREGTGEPILDIWEQKSGHLRSVTDTLFFAVFRCFERFLGICYQGHICMICCPMGSQPIPEVISCFIVVKSMKMCVLGPFRTW